MDSREPNDSTKDNLATTSTREEVEQLLECRRAQRKFSQQSREIEELFQQQRLIHTQQRLISAQQRKEDDKERLMESARNRELSAKEIEARGNLRIRYIEECVEYIKRINFFDIIGFHNIFSKIVPCLEQAWFYFAKVYSPMYSTKTEWQNIECDSLKVLLIRIRDVVLRDRVLDTEDKKIINDIIKELGWLSSSLKEAMIPLCNPMNHTPDGRIKFSGTESLYGSKEELFVDDSKALLVQSYWI